MGAALLGGVLALLTGKPDGLTTLGGGVVVFLFLLWPFSKVMKKQRFRDAFQVTVGTTSGQSYSFWSEDQDEVEDVVQALNESVANYQKN
jgi:hypothetical protein